MRPRLAFVLVGAAVLPFALAIAGCGGSSPHISGLQTVAGDCGSIQFGGEGDATKLIVSDLPLKGDSAERSRQMNLAIVQLLASKQWQAGPGRYVAFQACDDSIGSTGEWDPDLCRSNAQAYASNPDVIGVIGTYNSGCAAIEMPILNQAPGGGVPMVSPGNTYVCLTQPSPTLCDKREPGAYFPSGKRNYVRVVPNDAVQGAGLASFARAIGVKRPFVLYAADDPTSRGQAMTFDAAAAALGMLPQGAAQWDPNADNYAVQMNKVRHSGADAVVLAGILEQNGVQLIRDKVTALGPNDGPVKLLAFDGFGQQATIDNTGPDASGMYVSLPGRVPGELTGQGQAFVQTMREGVTNPIEVFAPYAGQAAAVLTSAIRTGGGTRAGTIDQLFATNVQGGIIGSFRITPTGDPEPAPISVQRADQQFTLVRTIAPPPQLVDAARGG
jgi:branched-chain amino acid transport system substrate-binding protein